MTDNDLKILFKKWQEAETKIPLPPHHDHLFAQRLKRLFKTKRVSRFMLRAASLLVLVSLGSFAVYLTQLPDQEVVQFQKAEQHFFQLIETQMEALETQGSPQMKKIVSHSQKQLQKMQQDYTALYQQWEQNPTQPQLIAALLENLRLQNALLIEIQNKITQIQKANYEIL